ncbi:MAG: TetR/AcrR family transcriptional regulator [Solirubrobacteraceae bacterium]|jgi:AcrR family transcriptional regulator|nr:TetR/AcrR family transcriptional regulator [Solirubrobacteraceae bacterium]
MASVTRRTQRAREARRDELHRQLLEALERLIEQGESFTEISVEQLAAEIGISRTTFYVYFSDKGDVLGEGVAAIADELAEALSGWWAIDTRSTRADLRAAIARAADAYRPHTALMAAAFQAAEYDAGVRELTEAFMDANIASLQRHLKAGQKGGFVDPQLPADDVAIWLLWAAERGFHVILPDLDDAGYDRQLDAFTAIAWNTLYAPTRA